MMLMKKHLIDRYEAGTSITPTPEGKLSELSRSTVRRDVVREKRKTPLDTAPSNLGNSFNKIFFYNVHLFKNT